jgi:hypothetical protein
LVGDTNTTGFSISETRFIASSYILYPYIEYLL